MRIYISGMVLHLMLLLASGAIAGDGEQEMADFVGGVYREKGFAVVLDKDTALVNGKLINRDGDIFITPKGVYSNDRGTYSSRNGIVVQDRDLFSGKEGAVVGSGSLYFGGGGQTIVSTGVTSTMRKP
jgi:hypothetical protein